MPVFPFVTLLNGFDSVRYPQGAVSVIFDCNKIKFNIFLINGPV